MKGEIMTTSRLFLGICFAGALFGMTIFMSTTAHGQDTEYQIPKGVYIKLTKEFYDALKDHNSAGAKVYTNDSSTEYLRQIAISNRFLVKTNIEILKQQEQMIELLQSLQAKKKR